MDAEDTRGVAGDELREAVQGETERTPLVVLIGVAAAVGTLVGLVTLATVLAIRLAG